MRTRSHMYIYKLHRIAVVFQQCTIQKHKRVWITLLLYVIISESQKLWVSEVSSCTNLERATDHGVLKTQIPFLLVSKPDVVVFQIETSAKFIIHSYPHSQIINKGFNQPGVHIPCSLKPSDPSGQRRGRRFTAYRSAEDGGWVCLRGGSYSLWLKSTNYLTPFKYI